MSDLEQARSELAGKFSKREIEIVEHITMEALKKATLVERARILAWCEKNNEVVYIDQHLYQMVNMKRLRVHIKNL